jgi:hypothetical protein
VSVVAGGSKPSEALDRSALAGFAAAVPVLILAILITFLAWPILNHPAATGLDPSWQIGLHLVTWMDLRQGVDFVFTYGPLGFLSVPVPYLGGTSLLALLAVGAVYFGLVAFVLVESRRLVPLWAAILVTLAIARVFASLQPFEAFEALVFVVCVEALGGRIRLPPASIAVGLGIAAAIASFGKLNTGVFIAAMGLATAVTIDRRWWLGLAAFAGSAIVSGLVFWVGTGQSIVDLPAFVVGGVQIISGYSEAMGADRDPGLLWMYIAFAGIVGLFAWTAFEASRDWPDRRRLGLALVCIVLTFAMWKVAFTRWNTPYAFATFLVAVAILGPRLRDRRVWMTSLLVVGLVSLAAARVTPASYVDVVASARSLAREAVTAVVPSRAAGAEERSRSTLRSKYGLDAATLAELSGHRVSIDPYEVGVAFAYPELTWAPLPVFQSYSAYTPALDRLNADRLASAMAPDRILRGVQLISDPPDWLSRQRGRPLAAGESIPFTVDGRNRWFEAPATTLETFCRYRQLSANATWQVLGVSGGSCGPAEPLGSVVADAGAVVQVPIEQRPDRFVVVRVHGLEPSVVDRVKAALYKATEWYVTIDGVRYRLVAPTASDGLLLAVPPAADGTGAFSFGPPIATLSIASNQRGGQRTLTYEFESVPLIGR